MAEPISDGEPEEQTAGLQCEPQELQNELHTVEDTSDEPLEGPRRSERTRHTTEKMQALQCEEAKKREKKLLSMYEKWKVLVRKARDQLKAYMPESQLWPLIDELKQSKQNIMSMYCGIRDLAIPSNDIRRRIDSCESVTTEIVTIAYNRTIDQEDEFNEEQESVVYFQVLHMTERP